MVPAPWLRRLSADVLVQLWNAWGAAAYVMKRRGERARAFRRFCRENGVESPPGSERQIHDFYRRFERCNAEVVIGSVLNDPSKLDGIFNRFRIIGREILEAYRDGGAILVAYHIGPFSMIPVLLVKMQFHITILARADELEAGTRRPLSEINRILADRLAGFGCGKAQVVDALGMLSLIHIKKAINRKEFLVLYPDTAKSSSVSWAPIPFFRQQLAGHLGLAKLLQMTRADVIHLVTSWDPQGGMVLEVLGPCPYRPDAPPEELLRTIYSKLEGLMANHLPQWIQVQSYDELKFDFPLPPAPKA